MLLLPGKEEVTNRDRLDKEVERQLKIMEKNDVESPEYKFAFQNYKELHEQQLSEDKLVESKHSRWFEAACTGVLAIMTITSEYWTPITSRWGNTIMRPFQGKHKIGQ